MQARDLGLDRYKIDLSSDAHSRYANIDGVYLLRKMGDYDGIVILASNLSRNIDEAFSGRMHCVVVVPLELI